jgi:hypothetical protein
MLDPRECTAHRLRLQMRASHAALSFDGGEPRALEHAHVLGNRGERHVEARGELADRPIAGGEPREDLASGWIGEREERGVKRLGLVNHVV